MPLIRLSRHHLVTALLCTVLASMLIAAGFMYTATAQWEPAPQAHDLAVMLHNIGLDPESLAAAGVSAEATTAIVNNVRSSLLDDFTQLNAARDALAALKAEKATHTQTVRAGLATEQQINELESLRQQVAAADNAMKAEYQAIFNDAISELPNTAKTYLEILKQNRNLDVPIQYRALNQTHAEILELRNALAAVRIAQQANETPCPQSWQCIQHANANTAVSEITVNLQNLNTVKIAWNNAVWQ